jgi:hypothetical protein
MLAQTTEDEISTIVCINLLTVTWMVLKRRAPLRKQKVQKKCLQNINKRKYK